jgi:soluble lytic murein transglycosylase-like protein
MKENPMGLQPDNPIGSPKFYPVPPLPPGMGMTPGNGASDPESFLSLIKEASDAANPSAKRPDQQQPAEKAQKFLELSQRVKLQMNQSLLRIGSDSESESRSESVSMGGLFDFLPGSVKTGYPPSIIRQNPSEIDKADAIVTGQNVGKASAKFSNNPRAQEVDGIIRKAAATYDVDPELIRGVIQAESDFNPKAISPKGAMGLMQLMPGTARELGVTDPMDPASNVMGGTRYLKKLLDRYDGSVPLALAAYNWGMGNLDSHRGRLPEETRNYVAKITKSYRTGTDAVA